MNNIGQAITQVIEENNLSSLWNENICKELEKLNLNLSDKRKDLTKVPFVTIDGSDAKDFDDAIHCIESQSSYILSVAIADVAELVKTKSALDKEAMHEGTSIYFPSKVIPMLPEKISNDLCSLVPNKERNTVVCEMTISFSGIIESYKFLRLE